ncbi:helix-turn-helix domain-containing protein [Dactylosporangium sp. NPDC006015]|uniref:helix-turn-helix domain-containing protein n=1 Tax=Dactylosporangium sp. NPDC006015 TaxID=3154576 RepID=UPI0033A2C976
MRERRIDAGTPTYRVMSTRAHYSPAALSQAAAGRRLPTWDVTRAFLSACNTPELELRRWQDRWEEVNQAVRPDTAILPTTQVNISATSPTTAMQLRYVTDLADFRDLLSALRRERRLSLRQVADLSAGKLSKTTISDMLVGKITLRAEMVEAYLTACGLPTSDITEWSTVLRRLTFQHKRVQAALRALIDDDPAALDERSSSHAAPAVTIAAEQDGRGGAHRRLGWLGRLLARNIDK